MSIVATARAADRDGGEPGLWEHRGMGLLPFDETRGRLRVVGRSYVGVREIPVERIVGSVDRAGDYEVPPGVDVSQLVHTEQQRILLEETGLGRARPEAVIEFTLLDGYAQLCT
jgi:hypothetical protein